MAKKKEETEAAPEMAAAVNESVEAATDPKEAPSKKEMTEEDKANHARMVIRQETISKNREMEELMKKVLEKNHHNFVYDKDTMVEIPGDLFAYIINFMASVKGHQDNAKDISLQLLEAGDTLKLGALDLQVVLTGMHIENCESGVCKSPEEVEEHHAKEDIKEVPVLDNKKAKKSSKKKATGSKS